MNGIIISIVVMIVLAGLTLSINSASVFKETKSSYSDGYNKGYDDAIWGFSYYVDPDHTDTYKNSYQDGYSSVYIQLFPVVTLADC